MAVATKEYGLFINGETVEGSSSRDLVEPASGAALGTAQLAGEAEIDRAINEFFQIGAFLDGGFAEQTAFNLDALENVIGRPLDDREALHAQQHQAARWTFIGSGLVHERFKATLDAISPRAAARIAEAAPLFA